MLFGQHLRGGHQRDRGLELVVPSGHYVTLAGHHRLKALFGDVGGIVLLALADLGVEHVGAFEKVGLSRARHEAGHGDAAVL